MRLLRTLNHPNIVSIKESFARFNYNNIYEIYMIMEYLDADLRYVIKNQMPLNDNQIKKLMFHLINGVS